MAGRNPADGQLSAVSVDENGLLQTTAGSGVVTLKINSNSIGALSTLNLIDGAYTANGTTLTLAGYKWPHSNTNGAPTIFATPQQAVFSQDRSYTSSDIGYTVLGNASSNSVYWTAIGGWQRSGGNLQTFSSFYTASGRNGVTIYDSVLVVTTEDPVKAGVVAFSTAAVTVPAYSQPAYSE